MRILYATGSPASYMAAPRLGTEQINCGPDWLDADIGGYITARNTPLGEYDLGAIAARLPADQQPDAVVCLVDSSWRSTPRNLAAFRCPKVLLVADTHHLNAPLTGMIRYAQQEAFDRVVLLYDRHHSEFFQAAGLKSLYWFPGLTFPHDDRAVAAARQNAARETRIAFVGQTGICHPRRIQMLSQLHAHQLPLSARAVSQREGLSFYASSLVGFNNSLNSDLNLRVFEILASGAMLLTDELAPASGRHELWESGRDLVTYGSTSELIEKARHAIAHPEEARAIGAAGARWFDQYFSEKVRRAAFEKLVFDGMAPAKFTLPTLSTVVATGSANAQMTARLTSGYEYVQELHRNLDRVVIALDESVPDDFARLCATLPRVDIRRGALTKGVRVDFLAVGRKNFSSPLIANANHVWSWEEDGNERVPLVRRCSSMGLALVNSELLIFSRQRVNTHAKEGAVALVRLEQGGYEDALNLARNELATNPKSVDAWLVMLEIAREKGGEALAQSAMLKLRSLAPHHPRLIELAAQPETAVLGKRAKRLLRVARSLLEQQQWQDAGKLAHQALSLDAHSAEAHFVLGCKAAQGSETEQAISLLGRATQLEPARIEYWRELARALRKSGRVSDALAALLHVVTLEQSDCDDHLTLAEAALAAEHGAIASEALHVVAGIQPGHPLVDRWLPRAKHLVDQCRYADPRDLLLSHVEVTRLQGTGVLIERFFPDSRDFVTVRSRTLYRGAVNFGGVHFSLDLPGLTDAARRSILQRLLAPYRIRRILAVPFFATDVVHALAARELTGAPLCTYVMDDQTVHASSVPASLLENLFAVSDLRLAISPEMKAAYTARFGRTFGLLPPIVTTKENEVVNCWTSEQMPANRCAMVGNVWSAKQFEQFRCFVRAAGLSVDWFGNAKVAWLPDDLRTLEADGIFARGFLPESQLAARLADYPFVVIPSGTLDGTEDNEWLTRLSLPSRIVFILTKTQTPMLVLGHADTAAARFVNRFGLGASANYDATETRAMIRQFTDASTREKILMRARSVAAAFIFPDTGEWIWRSLETGGRPSVVAPYDHLFEVDHAESGESGDCAEADASERLSNAAVDTDETIAATARSVRAGETDQEFPSLERKLNQAIAAEVVLPQTLNLQPIDVCNSRCIMCNIWKDGTPAKMSLAELRQLLAHPFFAEVTHVGVTGGEPTLRKDLLELYQLLPECLPKLTGASFITHGMQTERAVDVYSSVHAAYGRRNLTFEGMVSLDGVGAVHDRVRGRKNAFESASRTLLTLKSRGVPVMAACTIVRSNVYELHDLLAWGQANGIYVRFRVAEFIQRLYNESCASEIRSFTAREIRHLVSFLHVLVKDYEKNETIQKTYLSDLAILTGGSRLIGCPYKSGKAVNVGSQGGLASCAPKGAAFALAADPLEVHAKLESSRAAVAQKHCATCIHDYHDDWNAATLSEVRQAELRARELYGMSEEDLSTPEVSAQPLDLGGMKQVLLAGWYGTETAGDIAIVRGIISEYLAENPELRFQLLSLYPYYTRTTVAEWPAELRVRVNVVDYASEGAWQATVTCDAVVMAGGPLMDIAETRKILCLFKRFADLGKPRVIEGCGVGPLNNPDFRWNVCRIARLATRISVRDHASREFLRRLAIRKDIAVRSDPAVTFLRSLGVRHHGSDGKVIRCFLRELTSEYPQAITPAQAQTNLVTLLKRLLGWYPEHRIELWAMHHFTVGNDDRLFARALVKAVSDPRLSCDWEPRTPTEIFEAMASADFCVCMRFHSCVFAVEAGAPFLAIDYTAGGKIQGLLDDERQQHRLCTLADLATLEQERFAAALRPATIIVPSSAEDVALNRRPQVLHLVQSLTGGGGARAAIWLAKYSRRLGGPDHRVVSVARADALGLEIAQQNGVEVLDHPEWPELCEAMSRADIVLIHWWNHPDMAALLRRELPAMRLATWLHVAGYNAPQALTPGLIDFADLAVACSPHTYAHPVFGALPEDVRNDRTAMILAGADFERLQGMTPRVHAGFRVGYIGTVDSVKMHVGFVAMSSAVQVTDVKFVVCGNGEPRPFIQQAEKLGTRARFDFRGPVEDIRSVLETFDVYGYPLCQDTYAAAELILQEVMFAGVPVVAFPYGGIPKLIVNGETGILVNSAEEYSRAIEHLHQHPEERIRLGTNAAAFARQHWGAENAARTFNVRFSQLLQQPKRTRRWSERELHAAAPDLARELAIYSGTRMFIETLGPDAAPFLKSITGTAVEDRIAADDTIAGQSHLMRYNGILPYRDAWPQEPFLQAWAGLGLMREGNLRAALAAFAQARERGFPDWRISWYLAQVFAQARRPADAIVELRNVLRAAPAFRPALEMQRRFGRVADQEQAASAAAPAERARALISQAERLLQQSELAKARDCLRRALDLVPDQTVLMEVVCDLECRLGDLAAARRLYEEIAKRDPLRATPRFKALERVLGRKGKRDSGAANGLKRSGRVERMASSVARETVDAVKVR